MWKLNLTRINNPLQRKRVLKYYQLRPFDHVLTSEQMSKYGDSGNSTYIDADYDLKEKKKRKQGDNGLFCTNTMSFRTESEPVLETVCCRAGSQTKPKPISLAVHFYSCEPF